MFNPTLIVIEAFIRELRAMYERTYTILEPNYPGILSFAAQLALETIATSDAVYHDVNRTIMVTLVGQEILRGRHISVGSVTPHDWLHFIVSLLVHDIGYVRGICRGDGDGSYVINLADRRINGAVSCGSLQTICTRAGRQSDAHPFGHCADRSQHRAYPVPGSRG